MTCYWVGGFTSGTVYVYGDSIASPFSRFLVYVSNDYYGNWRLSSEQLIYQEGYDHWIDCGTPDGSYQYVLLVCYNSGTCSEMSIDCINCGSHF
jgi:hypothetical protein